MMNNFMRNTIAMLFVVVGSTAQASDFDGSRPLICATVEAVACSANDDCEAGTPDELGAPGFMRIDFAAKTIAGTKHTTKINVINKSPEQILMQGTELGYGWTMILDPQGKMTVTMAGSTDAFVLFGSCTTF